MADLHTWLSHLTPEHKFELVKIVFEKFLLAGVVAVAGAIFALLLEQYKTALKKREELTKIVLPRIIDMLGRSDSLYEDGVATLGKLFDEFTPFQIWCDALCTDIAFVEVAEAAPISPKNYSELRYTLIHRERGAVTLQELLEHNAHSDRIRQILQRPGFFDENAHYEESGLLFHLNLLLKMDLSRRSAPARAGLITGICHSVFVPTTTTLREEYRAKIGQFSRAMMLQLPAENRKQARAYRTIIQTLEIMREAIRNYPKADIVQIGDKPQVGTADLITQAHAALVSQLRIILYAT